MRKAGLPGRARVLGYALVMLGPLGCSADRVLLPGAESSTGEPSSDSSTTSGSSSTSATSSTATTALADDTTASTTTATSTGDGVVFLPIPDVGADDECSLFTQNCPPGFKCMPWNDEGGSSWNATRCAPLADDPAGVDEVCHIEGSPYAGLDDCERGAICWDVDPKTSEGTCVPFCVGGTNEYETPICEDPQRTCEICGDCAFPLCMPICDPVEQDCPEGDACYPILDGWECAPDASGDAGAYGDPCEFINVCDPGLICLDASTVPPGQACEGAPGCCTEVCDLDDPLGDMQCAGAAAGQACLPWYEDGDAPPGYEHVGVCALPP